MLAAACCFMSWCHALLQSVSKLGIHSGGDGDTESDYHKMIRGKVWRSKLLLNERETQMMWAMQSWVLEGADNLWMRIQHLDERQSTVFDMAQWHTNPFFFFEVDLMEALQDAPKGKLEPVFRQWPSPEDQQKLFHGTRTFSINFGAQVFYRCEMVYEALFGDLALMAHPGTTQEDKKEATAASWNKTSMLPC